MSHIAPHGLDPAAGADKVATVQVPSDSSSSDSVRFTPDSPQAWVRLALALVLGAIGSVGMWSPVVMIPIVQAEFGTTRGAISLAFTLSMLGYGLGGIVTGKTTDRFGIVPVMGLSIVLLGLAYVLAGLSSTLWQFLFLYFLIGLGGAVTFGPLMAEVSHWFERYRALAVTIVASGMYAGGAIWPPLLEWGARTAGWRTAHIAVGLFSAVAMSIVLMALRARIGGAARFGHLNAPPPRLDLQLDANALTAMLCIAAVSCCVAMAMPQVHLVAYCGDLGYGVARGAEMLSLMMAFGIVGRIASGFMADRIGGIRTLLIGSLAQGFSLLFYMFFDSLSSLYFISAMFGLFQGGIVPSYAIIVRESISAHEAATRVGMVMSASVLGMSFGGWVSGVIFDATGSYAAAFLNGLAWNALNVVIVVTLLLRARRRLAVA
jgi:MFS family permease